MARTETKQMTVPWTFDDDCGGVDVKLVCKYDYSAGLKGSFENGLQVDPDVPPCVFIESISWDGKEQISEIPEAALDWLEQYILDHHD